VGLPTTSQYSSKVSPVSLVSDRGDFTKPAVGGGGLEGQRVQNKESKCGMERQENERLNQKESAKNRQEGKKKFKKKEKKHNRQLISK